VRNTNENVSEPIFHVDNMLSRALRIGVVSMAQNISIAHICQLIEINVGIAQPTKMPSNPHSPFFPSENGKPQMNPDMVDAIQPNKAPYAT
jgi:hypothetical protein